MGTMHWQCPHCGEMIRKGPLQGILETVREAGDDIIGEAVCSNCGNTTPHADIFGGRHDVTIPREESVKQALPVKPVSRKKIEGTKAREPGLFPPRERTARPGGETESAESGEKESPPPKSSEIITQKIVRDKVERRDKDKGASGRIAGYAFFMAAWLAGVPLLVLLLLLPDPSVHAYVASLFQSVKVALACAAALVYLGPFIWLYRRMRAIDRKKGLVAACLAIVFAAAIAGGCYCMIVGT